MTPPTRRRPPTLLVTDRNLQVVGNPLHSWSDLAVVGRFNEPGSGTFTIPATPAMVSQVQPGNRIVVLRSGVPALGIPQSILMSGPIEKPAPWAWEAEGENSGDGTLTVSFAEDEALVAGRDTYPTPSAVATAQTAAAEYTYTGNAEVALRNLVNLNAGPGALAVRRIPRLALGALASVGTTVNVRTRFEPLGDVLRRTALTGGGLGYRTRQAGTDILFEVYQPRDLSGRIRFSRRLGNLRAVTFDREAPTATVIHVGGAGSGVSRNITEYIDAAGVTEWWRLERFVDQQSTSVSAELAAAGAEALAEGGQTVQLTTVTVDTAKTQLGVHYGLGDRVAVEVLGGLQVTDVVRGYQYNADAETGETMTALVGSADAAKDPSWLKFGRDLQRRLGRIERR